MAHQIDLRQHRATLRLGKILRRVLSSGGGLEVSKGASRLEKPTDLDDLYSHMGGKSRIFESRFRGGNQ